MPGDEILIPDDNFFGQLSRLVRQQDQDDYSQGFGEFTQPHRPGTLVAVTISSSPAEPVVDPSLSPAPQRPFGKIYGAMLATRNLNDANQRTMWTDTQEPCYVEEAQGIVLQQNRTYVGWIIGDYLNRSLVTVSAEAVWMIKVTTPTPEGVVANVPYFGGRPQKWNFLSGAWEDVYPQDLVLLFNPGTTFEDGQLVWGRQIDVVNLPSLYNSSPGSSGTGPGGGTDWPLFAAISSVSGPSPSGSGDFLAVLVAGPNDADVDNTEWSDEAGGHLPPCPPDNCVGGVPMQRGWAWIKLASFGPCGAVLQQDSPGGGLWVGGTQCHNQAIEENGMRAPTSVVPLGYDPLPAGAGGARPIVVRMRPALNQPGYTFNWPFDACKNTDPAPTGIDLGTYVSGPGNIAQIGPFNVVKVDGSCEATIVSIVAPPTFPLCVYKKTYPAP